MTLALLARSPDAQVDAVDGEPMMLDAARRCLTAAGLDAQVEFRLGDLDSLELAEAAYDLVWVGSVVHHLPDQQSGVDRLAALLRPGGRLALGEGGLPLRLPALRSRHRSSRPGGQALGGAGGVVQRTARRHAGGRPRARGLDDPAGQRWPGCACDAVVPV
jgi:SAM-dependent methyltransferase